jgi:pyridoxal phosphate enzyme (YggS family)
MKSIEEAWSNYNEEVAAAGARLVAVSKTKPVSDLELAYQAGCRFFGENKVQEMTAKWEALPKDIEWHFIGHLQSNKVKYMAPFVHLIHSVDSEKLLEEINKQASKCQRVQDVLLQVHIAQEETKFGFSASELENVLELNVINKYSNIRVLGLMGMASFSDDMSIVAHEFEGLHTLFMQYKNHPLVERVHFQELSMGMSGDYKLALQHGSTLVRIGSSIFGGR